MRFNDDAVLDAGVVTDQRPDFSAWWEGTTADQVADWTESFFHLTLALTGCVVGVAVGVVMVAAAFRRRPCL
jgi:hypothetical protein